jgi:hypothetical protein
LRADRTDAQRLHPERCKWVFRGIGLDPLLAGNSFYEGSAGDGDSDDSGDSGGGDDSGGQVAELAD